MLKLIFLALGLMALAFAGMAITILLKKNGKFPNTHISQNKALRKQGIQCASHEDLGCNTCGCSSCDNYEKE
ncbi:MAG: hypothetical protein HPY79_08035 [Bacteroidales bacterium]|nr:hypothetical protein [Bacteroidales bacterium]